MDNLVTKIIVPTLGRLSTFCHATICGDQINISGTLPTKGDKLEVSGNMAEQTYQTLKNIEEVLSHCGATWGNVAKLSVYIDNFDCNGNKEKAKTQFDEYNNAYKNFFDERKVASCARITLGVKGLALGSMIEIDGTAYLPKAKF